MSERATPRFRQIVAELRQRIEAGELAPGDPVPSTREIIRRWGVAMATATKVLTELRLEGLVHPVPGVGTVVRGEKQAGNQQARGTARSDTTTAPGPALTRERITAAAVAVADAEGLAGVSMRRVATEIGVATMSLYRHVADKDDLLMQMMDAVFAEWSFPQTPPEGWRARLELSGRALWALYRGHPWLASAMSLTRPQPVPNAVPFTEWVLAALDGLGLDPQTVFTANLMVFNYIRGTAMNLEMEAEAQALTGMDNEEWLDTQAPALQAIVSGGRFPTFERVVTCGYDFDLDELFEFGLQRMLDGLSVLIDSRRHSADT